MAREVPQDNIGVAAEASRRKFRRMSYSFSHFSTSAVQNPGSVTDEESPSPEIAEKKQPNRFATLERSNTGESRKSTEDVAETAFLSVPVGYLDPGSRTKARAESMPA
jgi:hypothetical protein